MTRKNHSSSEREVATLCLRKKISTAIFFFALFFSPNLKAAIGDNAPPIPSTYNTSHPRLPYPDSSFLTSLAGNASVLAGYDATADAWNSNNPGSTWQLRQLVIAYIVNKSINPAKAAGYLAKIEALANLGGTWGPLAYSVNDGIGNGSYTISSASANFNTGCGGSSCAGQFLSINGIVYTIATVVNANTLTLVQSGPAPSGSSLPFRVFVPNLVEAGRNIALIYDWLYSDLDPGTRAAFLTQLDVLCTQWQQQYANIGASPYNDQFYLDIGMSGLVEALVLYPDHPNGLSHLRFMSDIWFNTLLPVWRQVFGPEGGGWHESWPDYVSSPGGSGLSTLLAPSLLCWQTATGDQIFGREPWLKNFGYFTMYITRPDYIIENIGDTSRPYLIPETPAAGSLGALAEIYNDPVLRGWARVVNAGQPVAPLGFEPSAWPYYAPDNSSKATVARSSLPVQRDFTGWGVLTMRTGWGENDTSLTLKYGDNFWSHEHFDAGAFTIFSRGALAIDSGSYRSGSNSKHMNQYARQTIAHNTLTITDPADDYPNTTFTTYDENGNAVYLAPPNDGGQRRVGSLYNEHFSQVDSPNNIGDWLNAWDYYHMGTLLAYAPTANYTYAAVDITAAYNNKYSATQPNASNRTERVAKAVRHILFIPRGTSAYVVVYDQVTSTNASFVKRWLLHSVNQPAISGNKFQITRNEIVNPLPYIDLWPDRFSTQLTHTVGTYPTLQYQYDGRLYGWMVQPQSVSVSAVGGPGKEFWVADPLNPGTGTNWNECMQGQCPANTEGLGTVDNFINPQPATAPHEPGSWRIEASPASAETQDYFLTVMLATTTEDTNVPVNVTVPSIVPSGMNGATWSDTSNSYTVLFPASGTGGQITVSGSASLSESLLAHAQQLPASVSIASGNGQSGAAGASLSQPLMVNVTDSSGAPVPNAVVHFGVTAGDASVSTTTAITDNNGNASTSVALATAATGNVNVMAGVNGIEPVTFAETVGAGAPVALQSLACSPGIVGSGTAATCTASITASAGANVVLGSNSQYVTVPSTVSIASGSNSATFSARASSVPSTQTAVVSASMNGATQSVTLTVTPSVQNATLTSLVCNPSTPSANSAVSCTVSWSGTAAPATAVTLASSSALVTVPSSLTISGTGSANFLAQVGSVAAAQQIIVAAQLNGVAVPLMLQLQSGSTTPVGSTGTVSPPPPPVTAQPVVTGPGSSVSLTNGTWTMVRTYGYPIQTVGYEKLAYAASPVKKAVMLGNYHTVSASPNQALISYDFDTNAWSVLDIGASFHTESMPDAGHSVGAFSYDAANQSFIYYCCSSGGNQAQNSFGTYWFDFFGQSGHGGQVAAKPGTPLQESSAFDPANNAWIFEGGDSFVGTWKFTTAQNSFVQLSPSGTTPNPSVGQPAMAYDSHDGNIYMFGGQVGSSYSNALYKFSVASNTWTLLSPSGTAPCPRWRSAFAYDSTNNIFLLFGGQDASQAYNDSWIYNPAANTWTKLNVTGPANDGVGPFENLAYDSDHNVFIFVARGSGGFASGSSVPFSAQTWLFRYAGAGPNPGSVAFGLAPTSGGHNANSNSWAKQPSIASNGTNFVAVWSETGIPYDSTSASAFHTYARQNAGGTWSAMGNGSAALDSEYNSNTESHEPSVAYVAGTPWISWYKWSDGGFLWSVFAKYWNGSTWVGGPIGTGGQNPAFEFQGRSQIADVHGLPTIAFLEVDKSYLPQKTFLYVKQFNGNSWVLLGNGPLNINAAQNTTADSVSIASDGTHPYVAWTEYTLDNLQKHVNAPQVHVAYWNGSTWSQTGSSPNMSSSGWATDASVAYMGGQPYVAWTERSATGTNLLYVKTYTGGTWTSVSASPLNHDANAGWAARPALVADAVNNALYVAWVEQSPGQKAQTYVSKYTGGTWTTLGGSLNMDATNGSAQHASVAVVSGQPVATWGEVKYGTLRNVYVKKWNGSSWVTQ